MYLLKQHTVTVPDEIHENYLGKNIYRKDPRFLDRSYGQTMQTENSLLRRNRSESEGLHSCRSVCTSLKNRNNRPITVGLGPAVLAAGTAWKLLDFSGTFFLTLMRFCQEMKR